MYLLVVVKGAMAGIFQASPVRRRLTSLQERPPRTGMSMAFSVLSCLVAIGVVLPFAPSPVSAVPITRLVTNSSIGLNWAPTFYDRRQRSESHSGDDLIGPFTLPIGQEVFGTSWTGVSIAGTVDTTAPRSHIGSPVRARAFVLATADSVKSADGIFAPAGGNAGAAAILTYQGALELSTSSLPARLADLVEAFFGVPVVVLSELIVEADARGGINTEANAHAEVWFGTERLLALDTTASTDRGDEDPPRLDQVVAKQTKLFPRSVFTVRLIAAAGTNTHVGGPAGHAATSATAFADPVFSFDQQAFDDFAEQLGLPTFTLADYFHFEFSPLGPAGPPPGDGPGSGVPAPSTLILTSLGAGILVFRLSLRQRLSRSLAVKVRELSQGG